MAQKTILTSIKIATFNKSDLEYISRNNLPEADKLFAKKECITRNENGKWIEFVYCILAGTQFPVTRLKEIFAKLLLECEAEIKIENIHNERSARTISQHLLRSGYRYYNIKTNTIVDAARFISTKYNGSIDKLLDSFSDINQLRTEIVQGINGVGIKIASHWLRNIGFPVCTIDLHLRRLFRNLGLSTDNPEKSISEKGFLELENMFKELSEIVGIPLGKLQYSIWLYSIDKCEKSDCLQCPLSIRCHKGKKCLYAML